MARLRGVVGKFLRDSKSVFIKERNIFEVLTVALEVLDDMRRMGDGMVFKIYFTKAYDCVDCDLL